jgi:CheY-like chemotaxis protein
VPRRFGTNEKPDKVLLSMSYKVLVVDDSKLARMSIAKAFNALRPDWIKIEASGARQALDLAQTLEFDLAFLDFNMPDRDGLNLAADLKAASPRTLLVLISANHQKEVIERAEAVGATFLAKPLTEEALRKFLAVVEPKLEAGQR